MSGPRTIIRNNKLIGIDFSIDFKKVLDQIISVQQFLEKWQPRFKEPLTFGRALGFYDYYSTCSKYYYQASYNRILSKV